MSTKQSHAELVERRAELIAELFLQDLAPEFVARTTPEFGYDFLMGSTNREGGITNCAVQVKLTESPVNDYFPIRRELFERLAHSNIPTLLLIVNVKDNQLYFVFPGPEVSELLGNGNVVRIPVTKVDERAKHEIRKKLFGD